jgi:hypothetical protein
MPKAHKEPLPLPPHIPYPLESCLCAAFPVPDATTLQKQRRADEDATPSASASHELVSSPYSNRDPSPPPSRPLPPQLSRGRPVPAIALELVGRAVVAMALEPASMGKKEREPRCLLVHLLALCFFSVPPLHSLPPLLARHRGCLAPCERLIT